MIIEKYPRSAGTRSQLASLLRDLYPSEKRAINVALAVYDSGIVSKLAKQKSVDSVLYHNFIKQLVDEFGLQEQFAAEGIVIWAKAYGVSVTDSYVAQSPTEQQKSILHNPDAYAKPGTVNGLAFDYELEQRSQGIVIAKFRGFDEADVIIPNTINGKKVVGIGKEAYRKCKVMRTLHISDGIEFIEDGAFANCENLSNVIFPTTLSRIGSIKEPNNRYAWTKGAFESCDITNISLPYGLKYLGESTFKECKKLKSIDLPNGINGIGDYAFSGCIDLVDVKLPDQLSKIGKFVFNRCSNLSDISFPLLLREIGEAAFRGCSSLIVVVLNEGLIKIGNAAFNDCPKLSKILIPSTVSEIEDGFNYSQSDIFTLHGFYQPIGKRHGVSHSKNDNLTIYCYSGSYGLEYARKKGYPIQNAVNFSK